MWFRTTRQARPSPTASKSARLATRFRPRLQVLEDRAVPAVITGTNGNDTFVLTRSGNDFMVSVNNGPGQGPYPASDLTLGGLDGSDTLTGPDAGANWSLGGDGSVSVAGVVAWGFENLVGGSGNDTFAYNFDGLTYFYAFCEAGGPGPSCNDDPNLVYFSVARFVSISGGNSGNDILDFTGFAPLPAQDGVRITLDGTGGGQATRTYCGCALVADFSGIETVRGNPNRANELVGPAVGTTTWGFDGSAGFTAAGIRFTGVQTRIAGAGADHFTVTAAPAGGLVLDGGAGSDTYTVTFGNITGPVAIADSGGSGTDAVTVNGTSGSDNILAVKTGGVTVVTRTASGEAVTFSGIEAATINGQAGDDSILDPGGANLTLLGGPGNDTIVVQDTTGPVTADGGDGSDTYVVNAGNLQGPVTLADTGTGGTDSVTVNGTPGTDTIVQTATGIAVNGSTVALGSGLDALTVDGGGGAGDTFTVVGAPAVPATVAGVVDTVVSGTPFDDTIHLTPVGNTGQVRVKVNNVVVGTYGLAGRLTIRGLGGDDDIQVAGGVARPLWLYGDDGNDRLKGGGGNNVLVGGAGDDLLVGGNDRDILIGGTGADRIVGNAQDDILVAGATAFDADPTGLAAVLAEWTSGRSYAVRVANLNGTGTGSDFTNRLNGDTFLRVTDQAATTTVFDDTAADMLTGDAGLDWFFANLAGPGVRDRITDLTAAEFATDLSFIYAP